MSTAARTKRTPHEASHIIIGAAMKVHSNLGPGLLESAYEACLSYELHKLGLHVQTQVGLPILYDGVKLDVGYRIDMLVDHSVVVELKCVESVLPIHKAQIISYLKSSGKNLGLIINFNVVHLRHGIKRFVRGTTWK